MATLTMNCPDQHAHWQRTYMEKGDAVSWYQDVPEPSLSLIRDFAPSLTAPIIDVGGGASQLVQHLVKEGFQDVSVLDVSEVALATARTQVAEAPVAWLVSDVTTWTPPRPYQVWHDRAAFHFMVEQHNREAYLLRLRQALPEGAHAIFGTFAPDGPDRCSGLPVIRYDAAALALVLGPTFHLLRALRHVHMTPWGAPQSFQFCAFRRVAS